MSVDPSNPTTQNKGSIVFPTLKVPTDDLHQLSTPPVREPYLLSLERTLSALTASTYSETMRNARNLLHAQRSQVEWKFPPLSPSSRLTLPPLPPEQRGGDITIRGYPDRKLVVVGDLHGDLPSLKAILTVSNFCDRVIQGEDLFLVGVGDYINKGPYSLECLFLLATLLTEPLFRGRVILLRGNHEDRYSHPSQDETRLRMKFFRTVPLHKAFSTATSSILQQALTETALFFDELPNTVRTTNGLLIAHSGFSRWILDHKRNKVYEALGQWPPSREILSQLLWSDIRAKVPKGARSNRSDEVVPNAFFGLMQKLDLSVIIRGHQCTADKSLDKEGNWRNGAWWLHKSTFKNSHSIITLNSSTHSGEAAAAFVEVDASPLRLSLANTTLHQI